MSILKGLKAIIIGDRDGIPGPAIEECAKSAGAEVVFSSRSASCELPLVQWTWKISVA